MSGPATICLKRKAGEDPPEQLVVQKRQISDAVGEELRYTLKKREEERLFQNSAPIKLSSTATSRPSSKEGRRTFHLARALAASGVQGRRNGKRKREDVLTVEEKRRAIKAGSRDTKGMQTDADDDDDEEVKPFKQPSKGSAVRKPAPPQPIVSDDNDELQARQLQDMRRMESLADHLHQFALAEIAKAPKPRLTAVPKLSGARSREIHQQRTAASPSNLSAQNDVRTVDGDADYVYDTYVLAPNSAAAAASLSTATNLAETGEIGYLIISEDDESTWETFMEDEESDKEFATDDEDENAENYYGADYPEDELASDDEYGRGDYHYRRNGNSDNEAWDDADAAYSDGDEDDELDRSMSAWKTRILDPSRGAIG